MFKLELYAANETIEEYTDLYLRHDISANKFAGFNGEYREATLSNYVPFHGDLFTLATVHQLVSKGGVKLFLELGSYYGGTALYMGQTLGLEVQTCEPLEAHYKIAADILEGVADVRQETSVEFLKRLEPRSSSVPLIYVDSHGYGFKWELLEELRLILQRPGPAYVIIDDFKIPDRPAFGFDSYKGQECSLEYIGDTLREGGMREVYLSDYDVQTSSAHGLRGTCLLVLGGAASEFLDSPKLGWKKVSL